MAGRMQALQGAAGRLLPMTTRRRRAQTSAAIPPGVTGPDLTPVSTDVGDLWFPADDQVMLPFLKTNGTWEPDEGSLLESLARPGCRFLDIGANVGYFSLFMAKRVRGAVIDCVEPNPLLIDLLRLNLWAAGVDAEVWPLALGNRSGALALETAPTNYGDGRVLESQAGMVCRSVVPVAAGDEIFAGRTFDLIKVDVQGSELSVLTGLRNVIGQSPGAHIVTEFWPTAIVERGDDPLRTLAAYRGFGWTISVSVAGRLLPASDREILGICQSGGRNGQVNLLLYAGT